MRWRAPRAGSATPCAASSREPSRRSSGSPLPRPKRSAAGSTASPSRRAYEGPNHDTSARQGPGGPSPILGQGGDRNNRPRNPGTAELEDEIAGLIDRSTGLLGAN